MQENPFKITTSEKTYITKTRHDFIFRKYPYSGARHKLKQLEAKYGKYIYLPFDVPSIEPKDSAAFATWYFDHAKSIKKVQADVAGGTYGNDKNFLSINSVNQKDEIWETNKRSDLFTKFPEIAEGIKALPFVEPPEFSLWSSQRQVSLHRDQGAWEDLPASFRVMLYDENLHPTLFLRERPAEVMNNIYSILPLRRLPETNVFGWNNVRTGHGSSFNPKYRKVLMIFTGVKIDLSEYERLLERSVQKYHDKVHISKCQLSDFVNL